MARHHGQSAIYEVAGDFARDCFLADGSFLWPGREIWTTQNLDQLWSVLIENPDHGGDDYFTKLEGQLAGQSDDVCRLMAEVTAFYSLFPSSLRAETKQSLVKKTAELGPGLDMVDEGRWKSLLTAYECEGIGSSGTRYNTGRESHIGAYIEFARQVKSNGYAKLSEIDRRKISDSVISSLISAGKPRPLSIVNILLHLLWPDEYEGTLSNDLKGRMATNLSAHFGLQELEDVDETILQARKHMEANGYEPNFSMYDPEIERLWKFKVPKKPDTKLEKPTDKTGPQTITSTFKPAIDDLATATFLQPDFLRDIESLLTPRKQLIFEGPPGSGKTFVAEKFARYFTGQSLTEKRNETIELVQFHQSYSYEDFMEGIRPETVDGQLHYNVKPGIFRRFAERAAKNPEQNFVMIIDEINRGNVSRILGELMLLLEYRNETATLPYSQDPFEIPDNLYIIGTMNSADRSLSQIDYALRRRFYFLRFLAVEGEKAPVLQGWLRQQEMEEETRQRILRTFIKLNHQLRTHLETDDMQVGHSYFMHPQIHEEKFRTNVLKYAVIPLIREYLYHHRDRDELLIGYEYEAMRAIVKPIEDELAQGTSSEAEMP